MFARAFYNGIMLLKTLTSLDWTKKLLYYIEIKSGT